MGETVISNPQKQQRLESNRIKRIAINNKSLLIIAFGALSNFLIILYFRNNFKGIFDTLSLYLTYLGIVGSFGLLGFDQIFLRLAKLEHNRVSIGRNVFLLLILITFLVPLFFANYFTRYENLHFLPLYLSGISVNAVKLGFNANRLNKKFSLAQVFKRSYKIIFFLGSFLFLFLLNKQVSIDYLFNIACGILIFCGLFSFISFKRNTKISRANDQKVPQFAVSFIINMALLTLLGYGERILIANKIDEATFGTYFYYLTVFLFPLTLLQEYVGFRELVFFKLNIDKNKIFKKIYQLIGLGLLTYLFILLIIWIDNGHFLDIDIGRDYMLIAWMCLLGLVKLIYGIFSAILGAKGGSKKINIINFSTILLIGILVLGMQLTSYSLYEIILGLILVFSYRSVHTYMYYVK